MPPVGVPEYQDFLKRRYTNKKIVDLMVRKSRTWGLIDKDTGFGGDGYTDVPVITDGGQGVGATFYAAKQNKTGGSSARFQVPRRRGYGLFSVTGEVLKASAKKDLAFLEARARNVDGLMKSLARESAIHLFRDGTGRRGRLAGTADPSAATVQPLADPDDVRLFSIGMAVSFTQTGAAYRNPTTDAEGNVRGAVMYVVSLNEQAGTIGFATTRGGAIAAINDNVAAAQAGDYLVRDGDLNAVFHGIASYIPDADPTNTLFMNVDRSVDVRKLGGYRFGSVATPVAATTANLVTFIGQMQANEAENDIVVCSPRKFSNFANELGAKKEYETLVPKGFGNFKEGKGAESYADLGFNGIVIKGPEGDVALISDVFCPNNRIYALQSDTWEFSSDGQYPMLLAEDGQEILREANSDSYEGRFGGYGNLICHGPGFNGVMITA